MRALEFRRFVFAALLIGTAALKLVGARSLSSAQWPASVIALAICIEIGVAIWLASGIEITKALNTVALLFGLFASANLYSALVGHATCGCFGNASISPWLTFGFDICSCVVAPMRSKALVAVYTAVVIPAMAAFIVTNWSGSTQSREFDPAQWIGNLPEPLWWALDEPRLLHGKWTVVLHRAGCAQCAAFFQNADRALSDVARTGQVATIDLSAELEGSEARPVPSAVVVVMRPTRRLICETPVVLTLQDGVLLTVQRDFEFVHSVPAARSN